MAKKLNELTERTATADADLLHINSSGTDYKEKKANFLKGDLLHIFDGTSSIITQVDAMPAEGTWFGKIESYGHQDAVGMPVNSNFYVKVAKFASSAARIDVWNSRSGIQYQKTKTNGTWATDWKKLPYDGDLYHAFATDSLLTAQVDALPVGTYFGGISSYGHQSETGVPLNHSFYVKAEKVSSGYAYIDLWSTRDAEGSVMNASGGHYIATEDNGTWSGWTKVPTRAEMDNVKEKVKFLALIDAGTSKTFNITSGASTLVVSMSSGVSRCAVWFVCSAGSGTVYAFGLGTPGDQVSISSSTANKFTIRNSSTVSNKVMAIVFEGTISVAS